MIKATNLHPKAKKLHKCELCEGYIGIGTVYSKEYKWKLCITCEMIIRQYLHGMVVPGRVDLEQVRDNFIIPTFCRKCKKMAECRKRGSAGYPCHIIRSHYYHLLEAVEKEAT